MNDLRAMLGDHHDDVLQRALDAADCATNGYQVTRGYVDERDAQAAHGDTPGHTGTPERQE